MRRGFGLAWIAVTGLIAGGAAYFSYQAGLSQGLATKLPAGGAGVPPYWYGYGPHWGFGFFGFFWFLLLLLLFFGLARGFGRWGRHCGRHWGYEERLREWHREAHEQPAAGETPKQS